MNKTRFIYRATHSQENPYFQFRRDTAQDRSLTFEARGMLAYILSKPDDWKVQPSDLEQNCGKSVVYRILKELRQHGYIELSTPRDENHKIISWDYLVYEQPLIKNQEVAFQEVEKQELEKRHTTDKRNTQKKELDAHNAPRKSDPQFDIIAEAWGNTAGGWVSNMQGMMFASKIVKGEWKNCQFSPVATIDEVRAFGVWAKRLDANKGKMPTVPATIQRQFYQFRTEQSKKMIYDNADYIPVAERTSVLDGVKLA